MGDVSPGFTVRSVRLLRRRVLQVSTVLTLRWTLPPLIVMLVITVLVEILRLTLLIPSALLVDTVSRAQVPPPLVLLEHSLTPQATLRSLTAPTAQLVSVNLKVS